MRRPTILVGVASDQRNELCAELEAAGFPVAIVTSAADLEATLRGVPGIGAAIIDAESNIEAALAETRGRVSGPLGAAARLGIPRSTLDSKIRSLKISTHRFKTV